MLKEIFTSAPHSQFCIKKKKKQIKYNTADHVVDMQAVNFVLMKQNEIFFILDHNRQEIFYSITL